MTHSPLRGLVVAAAFAVVLGTGTAHVMGQPAFSKAFLPDTIGPGSVATLTFTVTNGGSVEVTDLAFTDTLPAGVTIAAPPVAVSTCGGALTAPQGGSTITFTGGVLPPFLLCVLSVNVTAATAATYMNTTGDLTSSAGNSGPASPPGMPLASG